MSTLAKLITGRRSIPINGMAQFANAPVLYTDALDQTWLKAGNVDTDTASYPDALTGLVPGEVDSAVYVDDFQTPDSSLTGQHVTDVFISESGTKMYTSAARYGRIYEYDMSIPFDLTTAVYNDKVNTGISSIMSMWFNPELTKLYVSDDIGDDIEQWTLSTPGNITTATKDSISLNMGSVLADCRGMYMTNDGFTMYIMRMQGYVYRWDLSTAWDISTAVYSAPYYTATEVSTNGATGLSFNDDQSTMYISCQIQDKVFQYELSTPGDVTTAVYSSKSYAFASPATTGNPYGLAIVDGGNKMFITGYLTKVYSYTLGTPGVGIYNDEGLEPDTYVRVK